MITLSPQEKIKLMRLYETNPSSAILSIIGLINEEVANKVDSEIKTVKLELANSLRKEIPDIDKILKAVKGNDGEDSDPKVVAQILANNQNFAKLTKGDRGEKGDSIKGEQGKEGKDGRDGKNGERGAEGKGGKDGKEGKDGKDGSPDKPLEVAEKLNTLEEKIEQKVIKGLEKRFKDLIALMREKKGGGSTGGGMGKWVHQQTAVSSVTTTVTLSYNVAANSNAILVRYQGQLLAHNVQYTISGKIITLLFTPENSTYIDATYVRT